MTITGVHPYADKFPMLPEPELAELAESIRANGLRNPIVLTPDGLILDGRNRAAACERVGVAPTTTVYEGDDLAEYVIDCNTSRRHMSTGARAMATALVLLDAKGRENGRWVRSRGPKVGDISEFRNNSTWREAVSQAGLILDHSAVQAMNNRRTRRLPRDFRRLPHPGMDPNAELIAEHRRLSAVVDVASLLGRETAAVRWTVYELRDLETELDARGVRVPRRWFTPNT